MNWRRGLFRAWVLFSAVWVTGAAALTYLHWHYDPVTATALYDPWSQFSDTAKPNDWVDAVGNPARPLPLLPRWGWTILVGFLVPPLAFVAGIAALWIGRGFKDNQKL